MVEKCGAIIRDYLLANWNATTFTKPTITLYQDAEDPGDKPVNSIAILDIPTECNTRHMLEAHYITIYVNTNKTSITSGKSNLFTTQFPVMYGELIRLLKAGDYVFGTNSSFIFDGKIFTKIEEIEDLGAYIRYLVEFTLITL